MREHFHNNIDSQCSIPKFVRDVWGFHMKSINMAGQPRFELPVDLCEEYLHWLAPRCTPACTEEQLGRKEETVVDVFEGIWNYLASQLPPRTNNQAPSFINLKERSGHSPRVSNMPDFCTAPFSALATGSWNVMFTCGDIVKRCRTDGMLQGYGYDKFVDMRKAIPVSTIISTCDSLW